MHAEILCKDEAWIMTCKNGMLVYTLPRFYYLIFVAFCYSCETLLWVCFTCASREILHP